MPNELNILKQTHDTLATTKLNEVLDLAERTTDLSEREFYMTLFGYELQKRQRAILPKTGGTYFDFSNE